MRGLYIYSTNDSDYKSNGESKKVLSQFQTFLNAGVSMELIDVVQSSKIHKVLRRLPFFGIYPKAARERILSKTTGLDFIYIRKNLFDGSYYKLLKAVKKANPHICIIVEIPTYPYFSEWSRLIDKPFIIKENHTLPKIKHNQLVDYYTTLSNDDKIFDVETIRFNNGISIDDYVPKRDAQSLSEIHLTGVALLATWHGYDRVIEGMHDYYASNPEKEVFFHVVGEGSELSTLQKLVEKRGLGRYVRFEGKLFGDALNALYDKSNLGIGSLGLYRINLESANTLKAREYCAKGLPFIKAGSDPAFDDFPYCLSFENNNEPIDIGEIIEFVNKIDYSEAILLMREYAQHNLSWDRYIADIIDKVKNGISQSQGAFD